MHIFLGLLLWLAVPSDAEQANNFYHVSIKIADYSAAEKQRAFLQAFQQVIVKLTGLDNSLENDVLLDAMQQPDRYVRLFSYHKNDRQELWLNIEFEPYLINQQLDASQLTRWFRHLRPKIEVSLSVKLDTHDHQLYSNSLIVTELNQQIEKAMYKAFDQRGLTVSAVPHSLNGIHNHPQRPKIENRKKSDEAESKKLTGTVYSNEQEGGYL